LPFSTTRAVVPSALLDRVCLQRDVSSPLVVRCLRQTAGLFHRGGYLVLSFLSRVFGRDHQLVQFAFLFVEVFLQSRFFIFELFSVTRHLNNVFTRT